VALVNDGYHALVESKKDSLRAHKGENQAQYYADALKMHGRGLNVHIANE